jgi:hypothetical protein
MDDYNKFIEILMRGDYREGSAWGGTGIGWFWGGKTIQGIIPYYYNKVTAPDRSVILDRCIYNSMADTENCSYVNVLFIYSLLLLCCSFSTQLVDELVSAHFTVCQKPWSCPKWELARLCVDLHKRCENIIAVYYVNIIFRWFELRKEAEAYFGLAPSSVIDHCAKGRGQYDAIRVVDAILPEAFRNSFNKISVSNNLLPTCGSGYDDIGSC